MASRAEIVQIAIELEVVHKSVRVNKLTEKVREEIDKRFNRKFPISLDDLSETLLKYMTEEYDYFLVNREGERHNYKGEKIE